MTHLIFSRSVLIMILYQFAVCGDLSEVTPGVFFDMMYGASSDVM